mmetsp:Transcript_1812/g.6416  ORF Transcript_1812/g.6416 Transcript_1812/m.6416 type:complete len:1510 (+) Transcript_1812:1880-6409(+)
MVRLRLVATPESYVFENRVNPIQIMLNVPKILQLVDFIFESIPDMDMEPPTKVDMPHYSKKQEEPQKGTEHEESTPGATEEGELEGKDLPSNGKALHETQSSATLNSSFEELALDSDEEEDMEKSVSFLIELRAPCLLIPSNSATGEYDDVSELLRLSTKEVIISSDPLLKKQKWTEDPESLYNTKLFPSHSDDHTRNSQALFDLARKFKFQISDFCMELLPSLSSQGQPFMDPISMDVHLGLNDNTLSPFHQQLPRLVVMSRIPEIRLNLNQNQSILLLELWKTYAENPPQLSSLFVQHTKSVVSTGRRVRDNRKDKVLKVETKVEKGLMSTFFIARLEKVTLRLSSAEKNEVSIFDALSSAGGDALTELTVNGTEFVVESHSTSRQLVVKNRVRSLSILSPPASDHASTISVATFGFPSPYVFAHGDNPDNPVQWLVQARYEHPLHALLNKETLTVRGGSEKIIAAPPQHSYNMNSFLRLKVEGLHLGLNVQSAFQIVKFLESKDNIFESSPLEVMTSTMKRTYTIMREKYLPKKKVRQEQAGAIPSPSSTNTDEKPILSFSGDEGDAVADEQPQEDQRESAVSPEAIPSESSPITIMTPPELDLYSSDDAFKSTDESVQERETPNTPISPLGEERPEHNDLSITELRKLRAVGKKLQTTLQTKPKVLYPLIWDVSLRHCELYIIEDELKAAAVGATVERTKIVHRPIDDNWSFDDNLLRQHSIYGNEFEMIFDAENIQPRTLVPRPPSMEENTDEELIKKHMGDSFAVKIGFAGSYSKPFTQRALNFLLKPHAEGISFNMSPALFYTSSKIVRQQVASLKEFQHLLKFLKKPTGDVAFNFERLRSNISQTQVSITRALLCHNSLSVAFSELNKELAEKEEALQSTIGDKMRLTQMLADMQMQEFEGKVAATPSQKSALEENVVLMECICAVLPQNQKEWKKVYAVLIDHEILCLKQKVTDRTEMFNMKHRFAQITVNLNASVQDVKTAVGKSKQQHDVIRIENSNTQESMLLFTTNEKHMSDWRRILEQCIEDDKLQHDIAERKKLWQEVEIQTEESSLFTAGDDEIKKPTDAHLKELKDLSLQLTTIKDGLGVARTDEMILRERLSELSKYVTYFEKEQERRQEQVKVRIAMEAERIKQLETQQIINKRLQIECKRRQKHIELIQKKHDEKVKLVQRTQEEKTMLQNNFREYLTQADKEMHSFRQENERLTNELKAKQQKANESELGEKMKQMYEDMLSKLQMQVAAQETRIVSLKEENIELRSRNNQIPAVAQHCEVSPPHGHTLTPLSPPDKATEEYFTMTDDEIAPYLAKKLTRDSRASVFNTSPRHILDADMDFEAATPMSPLKHEPTKQSPLASPKRVLPPPPKLHRTPSTDSDHVQPRPRSPAQGTEKRPRGSFFNNLKTQRSNLVQGFREKSKQAINAIDAKANVAVAKLDELEKKRKESKHQKSLSSLSDGSATENQPDLNLGTEQTSTGDVPSQHVQPEQTSNSQNDLINLDAYFE